MAWLALPALVFFVAFGVIPLLGVLALSFTSWDGHRRHQAGRLRQLADGARPTPVWRTPSG